jgi:hypothetical protein
MKRIEFLGILAGLPLMAVTKRVKPEDVPDDVMDHITITGKNGVEYKFRNDVFKVSGRRGKDRGYSEILP